MKNDRVADLAAAERGIKMDHCKCHDWASTDLPRRLLTGHHETCPNSPDALKCAIVLISQLVREIEAWGTNEDGIPDEMWPYFERAKSIDTFFRVADLAAADTTDREAQRQPGR